MHEGDIIANHLHAGAKFIRLTARAARVAKLISGDIMWTNESMANVAQNVGSKVKKLRIVEAYMNQCPCGRRKQLCLTAVRVDAGLFFTNANMKRGVRHLKDLLYRTQQNTNVMLFA